MDSLLSFLSGIIFNKWFPVILFVLTFVLAIIEKMVIKHKKKKRILTPLRLIVVGIFLSALFYFLPLIQRLLRTETDEMWGWALLNSVQYSLRLFVLDGEILWILDRAEELFTDAATQQFYIIFGSILYFTAPILTFGFVLSFFNSAVANIRYWFSCLCHTHVFSELNEKTLALATDIIKQNKVISLEKIDGKWKLEFSPFDVVVFTEITENVIEENLDLVEDARMLDAILFAKDFDSIKFRRKHSLRPLSFYIISDDEQKKLRHAEVVMKNFDYEGVELRLFSADIRSELLMASSDVQYMRAIRIDDIQTLVYHNLYTHGKMLFTRARAVQGDDDRIISAVIVGLGQYGTEMLKALTWFCQLKGYKLKINAFDSDEKAEDKLKFMCPELLDQEHNKKYTEGDAYYEITIHSGIDVTSPEFRHKLEDITDITYVFVCLGTDEINLQTAIDIRSICKGMNFTPFYQEPDIETVVYDSKLAKPISTTWEALSEEGEAGVTNFKGEFHNILITGDLDSFYSVATLIDSKLIDAGFDIQIGYESLLEGETRDSKSVRHRAERCFWKYEYNHNSSIAKAIHLKLRRDMGYVDTDEPWDRLTREEKIVLANPEHIRWNAYMRTIGYSYGERRNDLAKKHPCLLPTHKLNEKDLRKD